MEEKEKKILISNRKKSVSDSHARKVNSKNNFDDSFVLMTKHVISLTYLSDEELTKVINLYSRRWRCRATSGNARAFVTRSRPPRARGPGRSRSFLG